MSDVRREEHLARRQEVSNRGTDTQADPINEEKLSELVETDVSKRHVAKTLSRLLDDELVTCRKGAGDHGADVFRVDDEPTDGVVELTPDEITNKGVWGSSTWSLAIHDIEPPEFTPTRPGDPAPTLRTVSLAASRDGPPPE
jgi:hypothetical protein